MVRIFMNQTLHIAKYKIDIHKHWLDFECNICHNCNQIVLNGNFEESKVEIGYYLPNQSVLLVPRTPQCGLEGTKWPNLHCKGGLFGSLLASPGHW